MLPKVIAGVIIGTFLCVSPAVSQQEKSGTVPLYRVTVIERNVSAVNYQYRSGPTRIDFRGTVLLPNAKGDATVESRRGRTEIDAKIDHLEAPSRFGREYLTYVLWAISPEGAPHNLGELLPNGSDNAKVHVTTGLQAFGLIVTAEPYSAVRQPSDVVVLENVVRPDTVGRIQPINAKYELMPRGHYVLDRQGKTDPAVANAPMVSMDRYEALVHVYQAQNAIGIARAADAQRHAPNTLAKAEAALAEANRLNTLKGNSRLVVQSAREAAQFAEDARMIAERRQQDEQVANAKREAEEAQRARLQAESEAQRARAEASAANERADAERAARQLKEAEISAANERAAATQADRIDTRTIETVPQEQIERGLQRQARVRLFEQLNGIVATRDTPRGLVVTLPDGAFSGSMLLAGRSAEVSRVAAAIAQQPGLRVEVEGHTDVPGKNDTSALRAEGVRRRLVTSGLPVSTVASRNLGASRPITSNATAQGRMENRRVEIVISGDTIGNMPFWDRAYRLTAR